MPYEAVVFDLFRTIVDPEELRPRNQLRAQLVANILNVDAQSFTSYWSDTRALRNTSRSQTIVKLIEAYVAKHGGKLDEQTLARIDYEIGRYQDMAILNPRPNIVSPLQSLSQGGLKLGPLSNCDEREIRQWSNSSLAQYFNAVCFSCDIGHTKPDLITYATILERLKTTAQKSVYVGDGGSSELEGAKKAGFGLVVFMEGFVSTNGLRKPGELEVFRRKADVTIHEVSELLNILEV